MNIFSRLLKLYRTNSLKTPFEDFTTEILVGILSENPEILADFVNQVLGIDGSRFQITSQEHFILEGFKNCRVDIIIRSDNMLCFLENKIGSQEGNDQLLRYSRVLDEHHGQDVTYLRYCTKL